MRSTATAAYMGSADRPLFYCFDAPQGTAARPFGLVLCPPSGREYVITHRACRQFATRLSRAGFPVLRFDYFATGDSAGEDDEGSVEQWLDDISTAIDTLRKHTAGAAVCLGGLRIGATLAAVYAARHQNIDSLILWDPVVNGNRYVDDLLEAQQHWLRRQGWRNKAAPQVGGVRELFGFLLSPGLEDGLRRLDLATLPRAPAQRALLMSSNPQADPDRCGDLLASLGVLVQRQHVIWPEFWTEGSEMDDVLMPPARTLQAMVDWGQRVEE